MHGVKTNLNLLWALLLFGFTLYAALDTFVIERSYAEVEAFPPTPQATTIHAQATETPRIVTPAPPVQQTESSESTPEATSTPMEAPTVISSENSYSDGNISISIQEKRVSGSTVYIADVVLSSPEYLQTAFAKSKYGRNIKAKTSSIAENAHAILAVNGDYYGARTVGYVIRNGVLYRSKANRNAEDLVIYRDGSFGIIQESQISAQSLLDSGAWNVLSFGPALLVDGKVALDERKERGQAKADNPRTAIGIVDTLHYLFVVSDGRTKVSAGLSLRELAVVLQDLGATIAYNLDGGGSSTMVFQGRVVNKPTTNGKRILERSVSDIVCITL